MYSEAAMSEGIEEVAEGGVTSAKGFVAGAVRARMRPNWDKLDVALLYSEAPCVAAGVYTRCNVVAAPVVITRKHLADGSAQAVIGSSGCANAVTGERGMRDAVEMAQLAAARVGLDPHRQPPDLDEPRRRRPVVLVLLVVRRQREVVQAFRRLPPHRVGHALVQLHPHRPGHVALRGLHVGRQVLVVGREPQPVVDDLRVLLRDAGLRRVGLWPVY